MQWYFSISKELYNDFSRMSLEQVNISISSMTKIVFGLCLASKIVRLSMIRSVVMTYLLSNSVCHKVIPIYWQQVLLKSSQKVFFPHRLDNNPFDVSNWRLLLRKVEELIVTKLLLLEGHFPKAQNTYLA